MALGRRLGLGPRLALLAGRRPLSLETAPPGRGPAPASHQQHPRQPAERTELDKVLGAIQSRRTDWIRRAFVVWTRVLADAASPRNAAAVQQARELPTTTLSEIVRSLDPIRAPAHDIAHGLNITLGQTQFTDAAKLVDRFGVRSHHRRVLAGMQVLMDIRNGLPGGLTAADHETFLRCAGAAVDLWAAKRFWGTMVVHGRRDARTTRTWTEFIKARFRTEPTYYQFDRARVAVLARDLYSNRSPIPMAALKRMDRMRLSINALKRQPWNRRRDELDEDLRRLTRRRSGYKAFKSHWARALYWGHEMDEELLCASIIAFSRSSSLRAIKVMILNPYYGIRVVPGDGPRHFRVLGGFDLPPESPIRPTARLLNAIVEAFGSMSHVFEAVHIVRFISERFNVPIPPETWSNLLSWAYVCASKPFRPMRKLHGNYASTAVRARDVVGIWEVMTSEPYGVQPTFEDYDVYVKALIALGSFSRPLAVMRQHVMPYYRSVVDEYEKAVLDEVLRNDVSFPRRATERRRRAELRKDYVHQRMALWLDKLLKVASSSKMRRQGPAMHRAVPNLVREFGDFLYDRVRYRTAQGVVCLCRPDAPRRFDWERRWRTALPANRAGIYSRDVEGSDKPGFDMPAVPRMRILDRRRKPRARLAELGLAPGPTDAARGAWWQRLEEELML